jgi:CelD/BcsL family acetyltransferase involved in cellulose biosynthesis
MPLSVERGDLAALQDEWSALLTRTEEPLPFIHPTWARVWLDEFQADRKATFYAVRDGHELVGVAPLLRGDGRVEFIGNYKMCDYMDFVAVPGRCGDVVSAVLAELDGAWSELDLRGLRDPSAAAVEQAAAAAGCTIERHEEAVAPQINGVASWEEYLAGLSKKDRHELRRKMRRLQSAGEVVLNTYTGAQEIDVRLPLLLRMMADSRSDKANFLSEQMGRFFHRMAVAMAEEGLLRLYVLELDGKPVASVLCFDMGKRLYMYNSGYDPEYSGLAVGLLSKAFVLREAIEAGHETLDFLRGSESYKYDLGAKDRPIYRVVVTSR